VITTRSPALQMPVSNRLLGSGGRPGRAPAGAGCPPGRPCHRPREEQNW